MILALIIGFTVMLLCLGFQALTLALAVRYFAGVAKAPRDPKPRGAVFMQLAILMIVLMLGNVIQVGIWALLYRVLGGFQDFETAVYFSGVTFTSLGYGDVVLHGRIRLIAPLQAANGLMMYGITTAAFYAVVQRALAAWVVDRMPPKVADR